MICIIKWSWILFVKAETRWHYSNDSYKMEKHQKCPHIATFRWSTLPLCQLQIWKYEEDVLLRRRSFRIDWLTQIPYHFGCKFGWVSKSRFTFNFLITHWMPSQSHIEKLWVRAYKNTLFKESFRWKSNPEKGKSKA